MYEQRDLDFYDYWDSIVDEYMECVSLLDSSAIGRLNKAFEFLPAEYKPAKSHDFLRDIKAIHEVTRSALNSCYAGVECKALKDLLDFFDKDNLFYMKLFPRFETNGSQIWYRVRAVNSDCSVFTDKDLFHVPFELRHKIESSRFGSPGNPKLYLSGSLETALAEIGNPKDYYYAKFRFKDITCFFDLEYPLHPSPKDWEYYSLFAFYRLLIACMTRVKDDREPYKPEYLIPQLMSKIARYYRNLATPENDKYPVNGFFGIIYMSNKSKCQGPLALSNRNLAVTVSHQEVRSGYDQDLAKKLEITTPIRVSGDHQSPGTQYDNDFHDLIVPGV